MALTSLERRSQSTQCPKTLLQKAIKKEEELSSIAPSKIDVYSQQEGGQWKLEDEEASVERGASKSDCYGDTVP